VVCQIVSKVRKDPEKLSEILSLRHEQQVKDTLLVETVQHLLFNDRVIDSSA
jgi:hypothetical protein